MIQRAASAIATVDRRLVRLGVYRADTRRLGKLQSFLALWAFVPVGLLFLCGAMEMWRHGGGEGSVAVDVLTWIAWAAFALAAVILAGLVFAALGENSASPSKPPEELNAQGWLGFAGAVLLLVVVGLVEGDFWGAVVASAVGLFVALTYFRRQRRSLGRES